MLYGALGVPSHDESTFHLAKEAQTNPCTGAGRQNVVLVEYSVGDGVQTFGVGSPCTGRAALGAESEAW
jgi:hypothetical protein